MRDGAQVTNLTAEYDFAIAEAEKSMRKFGRGKIALLTLSQKSFDSIAAAGRYDAKFYIVDSRDSLNHLQYVGGRIVFSMPEYVAGVQFTHVILTDVNEMDDVGRKTSMSRARFGSNLYLGASRARQNITLLGNATAGGLATVVRQAAKYGLAVPA
jgi:hypothetical protein